MSSSRVRRALERFPSRGTRRAELSVAAYRSAFAVPDENDG